VELGPRAERIQLVRGEVHDNDGQRTEEVTSFFSSLTDPRLPAADRDLVNSKLRRKTRTKD
jgi:hypothetical protein